MKRLIILFLIASLKCGSTKRTLDDWSSGQYEKLREECSWINITQDQCEANNCCYAQSSKSGIPLCFME